VATQNTLVLNLSEDAYLGNAEFTVSINGTQLSAAQAVSVLHSSGQSEAFTFTGNWGTGPLTVDVSFINDAYGGSATKDRNLYVNSISYDGLAVPNSTKAIDTNSTVAFAIAKPAASPATTEVTSTSGSLIDQSGNHWTLVQSTNNEGLQVACNGIVETGTNNVIVLEDIKGAIVQENSWDNWYSEAGPSGPWTQISAPPSPAGTTLTSSSGVLVDQNSNVWTLVQSTSGEGLQIACNGTVETPTNNVVLLEDVNGAIVQENSSGNWYSEPGPNGPWTQISAPTTGTTTTTPPATTVASITVTEPATASVVVSSTTPLTGVTLTDAGIAASTTLTLTLTDSAGALSMTNAASAALAGSGTETITVSGSLATLNADLSTLTYTAGSSAGTDTLSIKASEGSVSGSASTALTITTDASTYLETHNFFAASSPWNTPIAAGATYAPVAGISSVADGLVTWISGGGTTAIYYAQPTDPTVEVLYNPNTWSNLDNGTWLDAGNSASVEQQIISSSETINPLPVNPYSTQVNGGDWQSVSGVDAWDQTSPLYMQVPVGALPSDNSDGQTVIIQPDGEAVELYAPIKLSNGQWVSEMFSTTNALTGQGTGVDNGRRASETPNYSGTIRDTDIQQGQIDHALAIVVPASMLTAAYTGVAMAFDSGGNGYSGSLPMGSLLALPSDTNIASLGLQTSLGEEIAQAAETYGMYIVDRGGSGISISVQDNPTTPALATGSAACQSDLNTIVHMLQLVTHN
jgi:hypothetical protein